VCGRRRVGDQVAAVGATGGVAGSSRSGAAVAAVAAGAAAGAAAWLAPRSQVVSSFVSARFSESNLPSGCVAARCDRRPVPRYCSSPQRRRRASELQRHAVPRIRATTMSTATKGPYSTPASRAILASVRLTFSPTVAALTVDQRHIPGSGGAVLRAYRACRPPRAATRGSTHSQGTAVAPRAVEELCRRSAIKCCSGTLKISPMM
jgi:hypothetical protein